MCKQSYTFKSVWVFVYLFVVSCQYLWLFEDPLFSAFIVFFRYYYFFIGVIPFIFIGFYLLFDCVYIWHRSLLTKSNDHFVVAIINALKGTLLSQANKTKPKIKKNKNDELYTYIDFNVLNWKVIAFWINVCERCL